MKIVETIVIGKKYKDETIVIKSPKVLEDLKSKDLIIYNIEW